MANAFKAISGAVLALLGLQPLTAATRSSPQTDVVPETEPATDEIVVTGVRESTLDLKRLRAATAAFQAGRAEFAPNSVFVFELRVKDGLPRDGTTLTLRSGETALSVPIDASGRFSLPDMPAGTWELFHNRGRSRIAVRPLVFSPGATEKDRPIGDLRLQCRAAWEIIKGEQSFPTRAMFGLSGGCSSRRVHFNFQTPRPISEATITAGARVDQLPLFARRLRYQAPLGDRSLPNDARIRISY